MDHRSSYHHDLHHRHNFETGLLTIGSSMLRCAVGMMLISVPYSEGGVPTETDVGTLHVYILPRSNFKVKFLLNWM